MTVPMDPCDLLVVAAFAPELAGLEPLLHAAMRARVGGLTVAARHVGIGLVAAASGTASALAATGPRAVVLIGTCGAYPGSGGVVGDVAVGRSILLVDPAVIDREAAFPDPMSARVEAHPAMSGALAATLGKLVDVGSTLARTTSDVLAARLARETKTSVEHLEAFAVATACAVQGIPFAAVLAVANAVGAAGREQWRANHTSAGAASAGLVARWIQAGAAGVPHRT